jgi:hypothetical protein
MPVEKIQLNKDEIPEIDAPEPVENIADTNEIPDIPMPSDDPIEKLPYLAQC